MATFKICSEQERAFLLAHFEADAKGALPRAIELAKDRRLGSNSRMFATHSALRRYVMLQGQIAALKSALVVSA